LTQIFRFIIYITHNCEIVFLYESPTPPSPLPPPKNYFKLQKFKINLSTYLFNMQIFQCHIDFRRQQPLQRSFGDLYTWQQANALFCANCPGLNNTSLLNLSRALFTPHNYSPVISPTVLNLHHHHHQHQ